MSDLTQLYQEIILGHNKNPRNYQTLENYSGKAEINNPLCGDEVSVYWNIEDEVFSEITFQAQGCAISRSSASMMTELLKGKSLEESKRLYSELFNFLSVSDPSESMGDEFGELAALSGVRKYPSRIKCATLAWQALLGKK
ncbi:MAG: SUF system NifU family Fe-S cluster assembly protein [Verrucomicrobia bacterium]|nr:SUF system NifU family Fe-S cluster assembly protein [Verrucomicrobiota bacterium]MDA1066540.1 SUF system NifU family Fe-S cluster assembly protein [Verrucomicrobiota bacterium]